jgi:lipoprotein signal peptidase
MNNIFDTGKTILKNYKGVLSTVLFFVGLFLFYLLQRISPELQFIAIIEILTSIAIGNWWLIDRYMFPEISLQTELKDNNYAFAIAFCGIFLSLTIIELSAFSVFFTLR